MDVVVLSAVVVPSELFIVEDGEAFDVLGGVMLPNELGIVDDGEAFDVLGGVTLPSELGIVGEGEAFDVLIVTTVEGLVTTIVVVISSPSVVPFVISKVYGPSSELAVAEDGVGFKVPVVTSMIVILV